MSDQYKLHKVYKVFYLVFETEEAALEAEKASNVPATFAYRAWHKDAPSAAAHWSARLGKQVWLAKPGDVFLFLGRGTKKSDFVKVLHGGRTGWIVDRPYTYFTKRGNCGSKATLQEIME